MVSCHVQIGGISTDEARMKSTGNRTKLETKFLVVCWTLSDYRGFLLGVRGCTFFDLSTVHHLLVVEIQDFQSHCSDYP